MTDRQSARAHHHLSLENPRRPTPDGSGCSPRPRRRVHRSRRHCSCSAEDLRDRNRPAVVHGEAIIRESADDVHKGPRGFDSDAALVSSSGGQNGTLLTKSSDWLSDPSLNWVAPTLDPIAMMSLKRTLRLLNSCGSRSPRADEITRPRPSQMKSPLQRLICCRLGGGGKTPVVDEQRLSLGRRRAGKATAV